MSDLKKQILIKLGASLGTILILAVLLVLVKSDINRRVGKIQELERELANQNLATESLINLKADAEQARVYAAIISKRLPLNDELIDFPKAMVELGKQLKLDEVGVSFGEELALDSGLGGLSFSMNTKSEYESLLSFLGALEQHVYIIGVDSVTVTRDASSNLFNSVIAGRVFSELKPEAAPGS